MSTSRSSPETSPVESELEKGEFEKLNGLGGEGGEDRAPRSTDVAEAGQPDPYLRPPIEPTRSRTSAQSQKLEFNDDEERNKEAAAADSDEKDAAKDFEVRFEGDSDPMSPRNRSTAKKWLIVMILAASSLCVTCASALYTSTYVQLERDFHVSREAATVGLTTYYSSDKAFLVP